MLTAYKRLGWYQNNKVVFMNQNQNKDQNNTLLVLIPGLGAVATTFLAGVFAHIHHGRPMVGSITQNYKLPDRSDEPDPRNFRPLAEHLGLPALPNLAFAAWDITADNAYQTAKKSQVLTPEDLELVREPLEQISPMPGVFISDYVRRLEPSYIKKGSIRVEWVQELRNDIRAQKAQHGTDRAVMVWCGSTERFMQPQEVHQSLEAFEQGLAQDDPAISPSQMYAYAALMEGVPMANGAPNLTLEIPALIELAHKQGLPIAGKDFKTGQTFMKTLLAPGLKAKLLGAQGWFSTNILGNKDGLVLDEPENFRTKEHSKLESLNSILETERYPELYGDLHHTVRINYYPPRGDSKEGWDNIDIVGWMGYPMQIKVNFLCKDSILAAPIVLDLALLLDWAHGQGKTGIQEWMSFYFKDPHSEGKALHDLMRQHQNLLAELGAE
jgi:myo-inositol-1-phosphate synthase